MISKTPPVSRLFAQHSVRAVESLDGEWMLHVPVGAVTLDPIEWEDADRTFSYSVPSVWEKIPELVNYRGHAVARRTFALAEAARVGLVFKGASHTARVFVDGREIGGHHNAYTPFALDAGELEAGEHELLVHLTNEHGEASALHVSNDYYNYGGLTRPVELHVFRGDCTIRFVHFTPTGGAGDWSGRFEFAVTNLGEPVRADLTIELAGRTVRLGDVFIGAGESRHVAEADFPDVEAWSPDHPKLYHLVATLAVGGEVVDDWADRTGFRTVVAEGEKILLNGKPVFLMGFNRHEDHAEFGCALPLAALVADVDTMLDLGCNAVRTSHYPNDERFLDLCDERGLMVWEENHARGLSLEQMQHPRFREQCRAGNAEMVEWHYNHPSILLWGILNECASHTEAGRAMYAEQFEQIEALDASRATTFASCHPGDDLCLGLPDVCGFNWYHNWYTSHDVGACFEHGLPGIEVRGAGEKPMIASEFGGGAIPGYFDPVRRAKWSEDRQGDVLEECLDVYLNHPRLSGSFIWQFCDVRVDEGWAMSRPRTMNNKGVVDERRKPKLSYKVVKRLHEAKDTVRSRGEALPVG